MLRYKVTLGYNDFIFDNAEVAVSFAQTAKEHYFADDDKSLSVCIRLVNDNKEEDN